MLYHFFEYLSQNLDIIGIGVFKYLSFRAGMAALFSLIISIAFGQKIINVLKNFQFSERIRDLDLKGQIEKQGTPTMGGIIILLGLIISVMILTMIGATQAQDDSLNTIMEELDTYVQDQLGKDKATGRFQLQSFQIERTHWHYMLDTATGELYRLEPSRTPGNTKWILTAEANF